uniref:very-long-chain enoyl-CoA reductase n=1 Tax=Blastobotrys adeninivorans TaxID=409370 RepID=A0A060TGG3_BLAAD
MHVQLKSKGKKPIAKLPASVEVASTETVGRILRTISHDTGLSVHRIRLSIPADRPEAGSKKKRDTVLKPTDVLDRFVAGDDSIVLNVKDLGPQVSWRMVYFVEYLGPLLIHPLLYYYLQRPIYGVRFEHSLDQQLSFIFVMLHFAKREYETLFVHKFSMDTMPLFNLFKNCAHYWFLSGLNFAYFIYAPATYFAPTAGLLKKLAFSRLRPIPFGETGLYALSALWVFAELSNFKTHLTLSKLREGGSRERKIPYGYGFNLVSFPNYFFEYLSFLSIALLTQNWAPFLFLVVGTAQMYIWAVKKHRRYRKDFPNYPRNRKAMFPFLF